MRQTEFVHFSLKTNRPPAQQFVLSIWSAMVQMLSLHGDFIVGVVM